MSDSVFLGSPGIGGTPVNSGMNLSFAGCGFLGIYHCGVASCFREYMPQVCNNKMAGASAGSLAALALALNLPLGESVTQIMDVVIKARSRALGPFHPAFDVNNLIYDGLSKFLPVDAHKRVLRRLFISVTRVYDGENVLLSEFDTREDLIRSVQCSCFVPFWSGIVPPKIHGVAYMDGGFSDNIPMLDEATITISPFAGEHDICPQDETSNILQFYLANTSIAVSPGNIYRFARILFPPHPDVLSKMCQQGFDDALKFLQRNNNISCTRCLAVQSSFQVADTEEIQPEEKEVVPVYDHDHKDGDDDCIDCQYRRQLVVLDSLPEGVAQAIQDACDQVNKGVYNWLFRHRSMKLLSLLTIPYMLPIDVTIVAFCKLWQSMPRIQREMKSSLYNLFGFAKSLVAKMDSKTHLFSAKFSCQLAVTEFDYSREFDYARGRAGRWSANKVSMLPSGRRQLNAIPRPAQPKELPPLNGHVFGPRRHLSAEDIGARSTPPTQRRSYAGSEFNLSTIGSAPIRRVSMGGPLDGMTEKPPERVISKINFGFTVDLNERESEDGIATGRGNGVIEALKGFSDKDVSASEIANRALNWERECLGRCSPAELLENRPNGQDFDRFLGVTNSQEALMSFHYTDEKNQVNMTEIFNITDADTSGGLSPAARDTNSRLEFDDFIGKPICINDLDDDGFPESPSTSYPLHIDREELNNVTSQRKRKTSVIYAGSD